MESLPRLIDVSCVRTDVTVGEIDKMAELADKHKFICCFAMPCYTELLAGKLRGVRGVMLGGVVGFPSGADTTVMKVRTVKQMRGYGCAELDMVIQVGALKSGMSGFVYNDIRAVVEAAEGLPVKTILEVAYLTDDEITEASEIAVKAGAAFIKTGTGWAGKPTTVDHIKLIKRTIGDSAGIKAAGGVRDLDTVRSMLDEGCTRFGIGVKSAVSIMEEVACLA